MTAEELEKADQEAADALAQQRIAEAMEHKRLAELATARAEQIRAGR